MPEGDTVWRAARVLDRALTDQFLTGADLRVPAHATADLAGCTVTGVTSRGKHLLMTLQPAPASADGADQYILHTTLGMDGRWRVFAADQPWRGGRAHTIRAVLATRAATAVGYSLPKVQLLTPTALESVLGHLGPDLLGPDWDSGKAVQRLRATPDRALGDALLDQRALAGVGNVYKSEICFLQGVSPFTPIADVPDLAGVVDDAYRLLQLNKFRPQRVTTGDPRRPLWVYSRGGQPCRRCGTRIAMREAGVAGRQRLTWWCPTCQPIA